MHEGKSSFLLHVLNLQEKLRAAKTALAIKLMGKLGSRKVKKVSHLARRMEDLEQLLAGSMVEMHLAPAKS